MAMTNSEPRTTFLVPESNYARLEKEVARLSRKAEKFEGWSFAPLITGMVYRDNPNGTQTCFYEVNLDVAPIRYGNWTFVARIDHSNETGNIIRSVPNCEPIDERFRHSAPDCQHCNHRRKRRDTFVLRNESGEMIQVGSTCLIDFLGHNAADLGRIAELAGYVLEFTRHSEIENDNDYRYVDLMTFLTHSAAMVRQHGWVLGSVAYNNPTMTSTKSRALTSMLSCDPVTEQDAELAEKALEWARGFENIPTLSDYQHNVLVIANASVIEPRSCGIAASIVGVYLSNEQKRARAVTFSADTMTAIVGIFENASHNLQYPKINITLKNSGPVVMSRTGSRSNAPGSIDIKHGDAWYGRILPDGAFRPSACAPKGIQDDLVEFSRDPIRTVAQHGHHTGQCCFCNKGLTDERSVAAGYGKTCASKWQLPY